MGFSAESNLSLDVTACAPSALRHGAQTATGVSRACYHVINRGNRRVGPLGGAKTRDAFERCRFEACVRSKWVLHAYVIMGNHFHLALETPEGDLAAGMQ